MGTKVTSKEMLCKIIAKKITPEGKWVNVCLFIGTIIECEQFLDSREWINYRNIKILSAKEK
tara:strand:+ start:108 stop:293 length:186 start_codon:yes stop_codon:yes gene_type:complete